MVCFKAKDGVPYDVFDLSSALRARGWIVPAYTLAPNAEDISVLRIVVREGLSEDMAMMLIQDIKRAISKLKSKNKDHGKDLKAYPTKTHGVC